MNAQMEHPNPCISGKFFCILAIVIVLSVFLGGKVFEKVVATNHFYDQTHACDEQAKRAAISSDVFWKWNFDCRDGKDVIYKVEAKTPYGTVILVVCVSGAVLKLITGYRKSNKHQ